MEQNYIKRDELILRKLIKKIRYNDFSAPYFESDEQSNDSFQQERYKNISLENK